MRRAVQTGAPIDAQTWRALSEFGAPAIAVPEARGGLGLGPLELCVGAEEIGRALTATPFCPSVGLFGQFFAHDAACELAEEVLPQLASGARTGAFAFAERVGDDPLSAAHTVVEKGRIRGRKVAVLNGAAADWAVVTARDERGATIPCLVDLSQPGVERCSSVSIDPALGLATLVLDNAPARPIPGEGLIERVLHHGAILIAFEQVGGAEAALEMARTYALTRVAFGRPIGSFQAIKHMLADMYVAAALAKANCYFAAWALAAKAPELPRAAAAARLSAGAAYQHCARNNIQVHGGIGFTWEADCHLHYRRANALAAALGPARIWEDILVDALDPRATEACGHGL